ncbi:MAG: RDD family protein [Anaerolineae bacterium]|nr:RDD family protein [Anaerolineae bacterium]
MSDDINSLFIDTPENVMLEAEIAGFGSRCMAAVIDYFILFVLMIAFSIFFSRAAINSPLSGDVLVAIFVLLQFLLVTFYHLFFEFVWNGQTPGKRRLGIRVVQANGMPLNTGGALIRNLVRLFDFLPLFYGIGLVALFVTKRTQRLGDLAARTIVIRERKQLTLQTVQEDYTVVYWYLSRYDPLPPYIDISALTGDDRRKVVDFLQRRAELDRNRDQIARMLAEQIAARMQLDRSAIRLTLRAELFLEQVAHAFELADRDRAAPR